MLSSYTSIYEGYIDNAYIDIGGYVVENGFENETIDPFTYREVGDDGDPYLGDTYIFFEDVEDIPIPIPETLYVIPVAIAYVLMAVIRIIYRYMGISSSHS